RKIPLQPAGAPMHRGSAPADAVARRLVRQRWRLVRHRMRLRAEATLSSPLMLPLDPFVQEYPSELCEPGSQSQKQLLFQCLAARSAACRARAGVIPTNKGNFYVCIGKYARD